MSQHAPGHSVALLEAGDMTLSASRDDTLQFNQSREENVSTVQLCADGGRFRGHRVLFYVFVLNYSSVMCCVFFFYCCEPERLTAARDPDYITLVELTWLLWRQEK